MLSQFGEMPRSSRFFLLIGMASLIATFFTAWWFGEPIGYLLPALLSEAALIFLSALLIERTLLHEFNHRAEGRAQELTQRVETSITDFFRLEFEILKYSEQYSVSLCPPRRSVTQNPGLAYERMAIAISRARWVKLFCTSGIDIFPPSNVPSVITDQLRLKAHQINEPFEVTVLSSDPASQYAKVRGMLENAINPEYIERDVPNSLAWPLPNAFLSSTVRWSAGCMNLKSCRDRCAKRFPRLLFVTPLDLC